LDYATRTMLEMSASCLLFLVAVVSGLWLFQNGATLADTAYLAGMTQDRTIRQTLSPLSVDGRMSGTEVFQAIARLEEGEAEIVVDGVRYASPVNREHWFSDRIQLHGRYSVSHERDTDGRLFRLVVVTR